ncbi:MAG TPA: hypothetical protein DEH78_19735 [Solibacterales bacterium]|nr:hypothetical protein [Bryobacterales bacterium]
MASLATVYDRLMTIGRRTKEEADVMPVERDEYVLRPLPNEDVFLFAKPIDNSQVVRQHDPAARRTAVRSILVACSVSTFLILLLLPNAYGLLAGYQIERLRTDNEKLTAAYKALEIEEAKLITPQRLEELARMQQLVDPAPGSVVYLEPKAEGSVAMHVK